MKKIIVCILIRSLLLVSLTSCTTVMHNGEECWRLEIPEQAVGLAMGPATTTLMVADMALTLIKADKGE